MWSPFGILGRFPETGCNDVKIVPNMDALVLADDATGALEAGAKLADNGLRSLVTIYPDLEFTSGILVVDTETRHTGGELVQEHLHAIARKARRQGIRYLYKKTDSTLRGNIGSEFQALLDVFPDCPLVYVPAYPKLGRTVRNGHIYVNDVPLEQTAFAEDPRDPAHIGSIPELLARTCRAPVYLATVPFAVPSLLAGNAAGSIILCDGSKEEHLEEIACILAAHEAPYLAAGPSSFLGHWMGKLLLLPTCRIPARLTVRGGLVVSGSLHPASVRQILAGERSGIPIFRLSPIHSKDPALAVAVSAALRFHRWVCLTTSTEIHSEAETIAERLGLVTCAVMNQARTEGLLIIGGDTTFAVLQALGVATVAPCGELLPGIPLSNTHFAGRELAIITKAGGFGGADVISLIRKCLEKSE